MAAGSGNLQVIPPRTKDRPVRVFLDQARREYLDKVMEKLLHRPLRKPWMKYREIRVIEDLLIKLQPKRSLEWGVGFGALHFPRLIPEDGEWIAVEHDEEWAGKIVRMELPAQVRLHHIPPDHGAPQDKRWADSAGDGEYLRFRNCVEFPAQYGEYDFILVDGRAREACILKAHSLLSPGGVLVVHDANRDPLQKHVSLFQNQLSFKDYREYSGGIWIGSLGRDLDTLIDVAKHGTIWKIYNALGWRFHL